MIKYLLIALSFLLVSALGYGFWQRGQAIAAKAHAATLSAQLTQAQSDLAVEKRAAITAGGQSLKLDGDLHTIFTDQFTFTVKQAQLEKKDVTVATYLAAPVPPALVCLLDDEDKAYLPNHPADPKSSCDVSVPSAAPKPHH